MKRLLIAAAPNHKQLTPAAKVTIYNRDSPDPDVGWHNERGGSRVCSHDCDNPEIQGSGAVCRDVQVMGMAMRECVTN
ncbi:MAG: hypothetical protein ACREEK_04835 [Bradyrhizobium sp.]